MPFWPMGKAIVGSLEDIIPEPGDLQIIMPRSGREGIKLSVCLSVACRCNTHASLAGCQADAAADK